MSAEQKPVLDLAAMTAWIDAENEFIAAATADRRVCASENAAERIRCADGHDPMHVLDAAMNIAIASIVYQSKERGASLEQATAWAATIGERFAACIAEEWDRKPQPSDVEVPHGN